MSSELELLEQAANRLAGVINQTGLQVGKMSYKSKEMSFLCRWADEPRWFQIMEYFLTNEKGWMSFLGKKYFINEGKMVAGWNLTFRSDDIVASSEKISGLLLRGVTYADGGVPLDTPATVDFEVTEIPLAGGKDRNVPNSSGRGVKRL